MQINCKVNVVNRLLPSAGQSGPNRLIWSSLTISENSNTNIELNLTTNRNKSGTKYRITKNVEQVFGKFVSQGKLTIRFTQPPHDLCLSGAETKQLEKVLAILKGGENFLKKGTLTTVLNNNTPPKVVIPKTKLSIVSRSEYPVSTNFPETLTVLKINNIALKRVDRRILHLKCLEILDLSNNQITDLLENWSSLPKLKQLILNHNHLKVLTDSFIKSVRVSSLDLSHNQLIGIPSCISRISSLQTLKVDHNNIQYLPRTICKLKSLRTLTLSSNQIKCLPASFQTLSLDHVDVFKNPFENSDDGSRLIVEFPSVCAISLRSIAAKSTISHKLRLREGEIPTTLITYLHEASTVCPCGKLCVDDGITSSGSINLLNVSDSVSGDKIVPMEMTICSRVCFTKYAFNLIS